MSYPKALRIDAEDAEAGWWGEVWPIGGVYVSITGDNPFATLGFGSWTLFGNGRLLMSPPGPSTDVYLWVRSS